jgi:hypothetical protein
MRMTMSNLLACGALTALAGLPGCVHDMSEGDIGERIAVSELDDAAHSSGLPVQASVSLQRERYRWAANEWTAGAVDQVGPDYLVVTPFIGEVGQMRMDLEQRTAAFSGNTPIPVQEITPGMKVRANFMKSAASPKLVSLEVLSEGQAARFQER